MCLQISINTIVLVVYVALGTAELVADGVACWAGLNGRRLQLLICEIPFVVLVFGCHLRRQHSAFRGE